MKKIIAVTGLAGSGKSTVVEYLEKRGFLKVYFGQVTMDELKRLGLEANEQNERKAREELRKEHGMGAFAELSLPRIEEALGKGDVVIDGMCSWEEYLFIKNKFDNLVVVAVHASQGTRANRIGTRKIRPLTKEELQQRDRAEIENLNKAGVIAIAGFSLINEGSVEGLQKEIDKMLVNLNG